MTGIKINHKNEALLSLAKREMHGRELAKELKTSLTRTQSILNEARKDNILDYRTEGRNHKYFIRKNLAAKAALICAESYKLQKTIAKHPILMPIFQDITKESNSGLIILFGSYAKGTPKEDSDIDIAVISSIKKEITLDLYEKKLKRPIQIFLFSKAEFDTMQRKNKELYNNILNGRILSGYLKVT